MTNPRRRRLAAGETNNDAQAKAANDSGVIVGWDGNGDATIAGPGQNVGFELTPVS